MFFSIEMWFGNKMFVDVFLKQNLSMHDFVYKLHTITFPSSFFVLSIESKNSNTYMMPKFNANIKLKLNLRSFKYLEYIIPPNITLFEAHNKRN